MRIFCVLVCLPHEKQERKKFKTIDYPFFFNTLIEELRVEESEEKTKALNETKKITNIARKK